MDHADYMQVALNEAQKGWGNTHPNPMVGAIIVESGEIVSQGYHAKCGGAHAEVDALNNLGRKPASDAVMYVTLEPCSTTGKTGPCTQAIIESGIKKVVLGAIDPDSRHCGRGIEILTASGVDVSVGILTDECEDLNLIFNHLAEKESPLIAGKTATTLDGKVATRDGNSKWITGEAARADVMRWRRYFPAIAVGAGTVLADDPQLTSRNDVTVFCPRRFIFDRRLKTISGLDEYQVFTDGFNERTTIVTVEGASGLSQLKKRNVLVWVLPADPETFWKSFRLRCIQEDITGIFVEGGPGLMSDLVGQNQLDYLFAYRAPKFLSDEQAASFVGGQDVSLMSHACSLSKVHHSVLGNDQLIRGFVKYPGK